MPTKGWREWAAPGRSPSVLGPPFSEGKRAIAAGDGRRRRDGGISMEGATRASTERLANEANIFSFPSPSQVNIFAFCLPCASFFGNKRPPATLLTF